MTCFSAEVELQQKYALNLSTSCAVCHFIDSNRQLHPLKIAQYCELLQH